MQSAYRVQTPPCLCFFQLADTSLHNHSAQAEYVDNIQVGYFGNTHTDFHRIHNLNALLKHSGMMESVQFSSLSSLKDEFRSEDCIKPHYKESYRLAIDHLVNSGSDRYCEFLKGERLGSFLSEEELLFITANVEQPVPGNHTEEINDAVDNQSSSGTYWPMHSDVETPDLDLGWPEAAMHDFTLQTNIDVLFHPPRQNSPTIKGVICKHIQDARKVIAIAMDTFTDADIFTEAVNASIRGVAVYILLNDFHLKGFLAMAKSQDVEIQQLRNMRVRTVKGQDYLCRSGAKFHGAMEQKFILVDCQTVIYGSYSFTWSFEKINLSMVQVITGHLVGSYDEEFRTLYARSTVPPELSPPEGLVQPNGLQGRPSLPKLGQSAKILDRGDQLRHTLDSVYRKTCERQQGIRDIEERCYEGEPFDHRPFIEDDLNFQFQLPETMDYLKRHSYAGERQDGFTPQNIRHRGSNWNVSRDIDNGRNNFCMDNFSQMPQMYRGQNMQPPFHGIDAQALPMQQNMPMLENTSKSFMRSLRIDSYLKNPDAPLRNSSDFLEQFDSTDKANSFMNSRLRSSLAFRSTIPEHIEENAHINDSYTGIRKTNPSALPNPALQYSSMQWNPLAAAENRINIEESILKRRSLQILDDARNNANYGPGRNAYQPSYATVGRNKGGVKMNHPEILTDNWQKRHSVADPNSNSEYDSSGQMYGGISPRRQENRITARINVQNGGHGLNLNEDQRSVSQFDVKNITGTKCTPTASWQEPPCRTVSAAALDLNSKDVGVPSTNMSSQHFLKKSSNKMRSLLNIPEKKEAPPQLSSTTSCGSTDTLTDGDEVKHSDVRGTHQSTTRSSLEQQEKLAHDLPRSSKTQYRKEEHNPRQSPHLQTTTQKKHTGGDRIMEPSIDVEMWSKGHGPESRLYSRFEPFCAFEKKHPLRSTTRQEHAQSSEKAKNPSKTDSAVEHNLGKTTRINHENKLEKFLQRMGNLMHKNKQ
ncbi:protein FAM83B [Genypterus blacodes]|uniref:protein FAM83B n=1 Tax=Genypterus blacodes TaxID=154954 RepID=UPI003F7606EA